ncbi:hypothetical protein ACH52_1790 [Eubacterium limosum]|nr:hypothetical protein ACH52_1790 [Eubacterium limosum]
MGKKKEQTFIGADLINGLPQNDKRSSFFFTFEDSKLKITEKIVGLFKDNELQTFWLDIGKLISIDLITQDNIIEKQKSTVGRGIAGAALFGPVGAIIGINSKNTEIINQKTGVMVVSYYDKDEEIKTINLSVESQNIPATKDFIIYYQKNYQNKHFDRNKNGDIIL